MNKSDVLYMTESKVRMTNSPEYAPTSQFFTKNKCSNIVVRDCVRVIIESKRTKMFTFNLNV